MTTILTWSAGSHLSPPTHPSERDFEAFLESRGYSFTKEKVRFNFEPPRRGRTSKAVTPDYHILSLPSGTSYLNVFIELCEADRYMAPAELSEATRRKNRRHAASHKAYISPEEYLRRKCSRMRQAETKYGVVIIVLTYADQLAIFDHPDLLTEFISSRTSMPQSISRIS